MHGAFLRWRIKIDQDERRDFLSFIWPLQSFRSKLFFFVEERGYAIGEREVKGEVNRALREGCTGL